MKGPDTLIGTVMQGRYRVDSELGEGGMGSVYRAEHVALGRSVAVKVLRDELAGSDEFRLRFEREATVLSGLSHPNIVSVLDYGFEEDLPFLVMEFLEGRDLDAVLKDAVFKGGRLSASRAESIGKQLLLAVGHAHTHGLVHRDLKPQNVVVRELADGNEHVTVLDFGLARQVEGGAKVTKTGLLMGTPAYMSPEQATGGKTDARSDIYSLGVMFYELFGGEHPFAGEDSHALLRAHLVKEPPPLTGLAVDSHVAALVAKAMSKDPASRFSDANAMLAAWGAERIEEPAGATRVSGAMETPVGKRSGNSAPAVESHEATSAPSQGAQSAEEGMSLKAKWALLAAGVLAATTFLVAFALSGDDSDAVVPIPPGAPTAAALVDDDPIPLVQAPVQPEAQHVSIWDGDSTYVDILAQLRRGGTLRRRQQRSLAVRARRAPDDARPLLLLGHSYVASRSLSDGMERYEAALAIHPEAAAEEWTAEDLITIAAAESLHTRATRLILEHYDVDFAARVEERAEGERGPWRQRLQALARRLRNER